MKASELKTVSLNVRIREAGNKGRHLDIMDMIGRAAAKGECHTEIPKDLIHISVDIFDLLRHEGYSIIDNVPLGHTTISWGL